MEDADNTMRHTMDRLKPCLTAIYHPTTDADGAATASVSVTAGWLDP